VLAWLMPTPPAAAAAVGSPGVSQSLYQHPKSQEKQKIMEGK
jgi:hypothetical protein